MTFDSFTLSQSDLDFISWAFKCLHGWHSACWTGPWPSQCGHNANPRCFQVGYQLESAEEKGGEARRFPTVSVGTVSSPTDCWEKGVYWCYMQLVLPYSSTYQNTTCLLHSPILLPPWGPCRTWGYSQPALTRRMTRTFWSREVTRETGWDCKYPNLQRRYSVAHQHTCRVVRYHSFFCSEYCSNINDFLLIFPLAKMAAVTVYE